MSAGQMSWIRRYGYFILGHFAAGHIMWCTDKLLVNKTPVKITKEDKMLTILWHGEGKMPILSKHSIYCTDGQVN